jgi:uncharacterized membrane protein
VRLLGTARSQPRLLLSTALAVVIYLLLPASLEVQTRGIVAWDAGCAVYLVAVLTMMLRATIERMERRAKIQDENRLAILTLCVAAVCVTLFAIGYEMHVAKAAQQAAAGWRLGLAALTIVLSWGFTHTIFALHYAHEYYEDPKKPRLIFPGGVSPDYTDFLYYAFVVGMTFQVSDVQVAERELRRLTLVHGVLSFFFNTVILALAINLAAGLL